METTLLNLIRGTGIHGLTGIPSKNDAFLRPFTFVTKAEIMTYATSLHLTWRSDASNSEVKYQRNKIRNLVVPILEEINPSLIATFRNTLERLEGTAQVVNERVKEIKKLHFKSGKPNELSLGWFQHNSMGLVILSELLKPYQVSYTMVKDIAQTHLSGKLFYSDSHQLLYDRGKLLITPLKEDVHAVLNIPKPGIYAWQNVQIQIEQVSAEAFSASTETNTVFVDATTVDFPITVRSWQQGDWFVPLGMSGKKKLSDFMIDRKIPLTLKQHIPIFCCGAHIIWVGGYQIDDRFKVRPTSKELLKIKLSSRV
jgi:tRNA(Ile)-lysidine synthase